MSHAQECPHCTWQEITMQKITEILHHIDPTEMVNNYILIASSIDSDGQTNFWLQTPDGQATWQTVGMLHHALTRTDAVTQSIVHESLSEPDQ